MAAGPVSKSPPTVQLRRGSVSGVLQVASTRVRRGSMRLTKALTSSKASSKGGLLKLYTRAFLKEDKSEELDRKRAALDQAKEARDKLVRAEADLTRRRRDKLMSAASAHMGEEQWEAVHELRLMRQPPPKTALMARCFCTLLSAALPEAEWRVEEGERGSPSKSPTHNLSSNATAAAAAAAAARAESPVKAGPSDDGLLVWAECKRILVRPDLRGLATDIEMLVALAAAVATTDVVAPQADWASVSQAPAKLGGSKSAPVLSRWRMAATRSTAKVAPDGGGAGAAVAEVAAQLLTLKQATASSPAASSLFRWCAVLLGGIEGLRKEEAEYAVSEAARAVAKSRRVVDEAAAAVEKAEAELAEAEGAEVAEAGAQGRAPPASSGSPSRASAEAPAAELSTGAAALQKRRAERERHSSVDVSPPPPTKQTAVRSPPRKAGAGSPPPKRTSGTTTGEQRRGEAERTAAAASPMDKAMASGELGAWTMASQGEDPEAKEAALAKLAALAKEQATWQKMPAGGEGDLSKRTPAGVAAVEEEERVLREAAASDLAELMSLVPDSPEAACRKALETADGDVDAAACELLAPPTPRELEAKVVGGVLMC